MILLIDTVILKWLKQFNLFTTLYLFLLFSLKNIYYNDLCINTRHCKVHTCINISTLLYVLYFSSNASFDLHNMHVLFADHKSLPCSPTVRYLPAHSEDTQVNTLPMNQIPILMEIYRWVSRTIKAHDFGQILFFHFYCS